MAIPNPRDVLERYGLRPRRSLGQNFMVHPTAPARIVGEANVNAKHRVLEVGAGIGTLTLPLAEKAGHVFAVETDPNLIPILQEQVAAYSNVKVVYGDILTLDPAALLKASPEKKALPLWGPRVDDYLVVANLPYYITSAVIRHLLEAALRPARMVFTVQYEVAKRMIAASGKMSLLSVSLYFYGEPRILFKLSRGAFYPMPRVDSAVVRLDVHTQPPIQVDDVELFFEIVRAGFAQRRKQLRNTVANTLRLDPRAVEQAFERVRISHTRRAESLSMQEWEQAYQALKPLLCA